MCITLRKAEPIDYNHMWKNKVLREGSWYGYWNGIPAVSDQIMKGNLVHIEKKNKEFSWDDHWIHIEDPQLPRDFSQYMWGKKRMYMEKMGYLE